MRIHILCFSLLLSGLALHAQQGRDTTFIIESEAFEGERKIHVHLPERYDQRPDDDFMVVYALDAHSTRYWNMAKGNVAYLVDNFQVLPMIVVGIHHDNRGRELIPANVDTVSTENNNGKAHLLQQHLREEVIPLIEANYRVNDRRAIVGHSRGGAFITTTLFSDQRDLFDAYIGISPAMHYMDNQIMKQAAEELAIKPDFKKFLFCTYGTVGSYEDSFGKQVVQLDSMIQASANESLAWGATEINTTTHWTVVIPSWNLALLEMSRQYTVDQYMLQEFAANKGQGLRKQTENYLAAQEAKLGWSHPLNTADLNYYANEFQELGMTDRAFECYQWALRLTPDNLRVTQNLAYLYKEEGRPVEALRYFQSALQLLEKQKDTMDEERYADNKEWLEEEVAELEAAGK